MQYFGVDIGGTEVKLGIINNEGTIIASKNYAVAFDDYVTPILETVKKAMVHFLDEQNIPASTLAGIGVSATGQVDAYLGKVIGTGGNIKNYCGAEIKKELEDMFQLPCHVMNDANCMLLGEVWKGAAKGVQNVVAFTVGTGVGGGILVDGHMLLGKRGIAGEIGHFSIKKDGIPCACGNAGCFERYASTTALIERVQALHLPELEGIELTGKVIFDYAHKQHPEITRIIEAWIHDIVSGCVSLVHIFNPELVVIGGGVSKQEALFIQPIQKEIAKRVMPRFQEDVQVCAAQLGNLAGIMGAVYNFIQQEQ